ncbi:DUF551 domain-containing protein [Flavonifractor plautii]|jgi:hypothetical protein|uniref:DUF551 domain-containing protein n=1 Tax=Flavonifractor plautii TaxID=292800 RepID=UPI0034B4CBCD
MGRAIDKQTMLGLIVDAKRTDPETGSFTEWLAEYLAEHMPTLTPPNKWVSVENAMPPEHEPVLCIASGSPKPNITLEDAYQFGSWNKADGWIIDEYLDWEDADVSWWMPLPTPPDGRPPEVSP